MSAPKNCNPPNTRAIHYGEVSVWMSQGQAKPLTTCLTSKGPFMLIIKYATKFSTQELTTLFARLFVSPKIIVQTLYAARPLGLPLP